DTVALGVEFPAVVDAAQSALFVAGIEQRGAAVGTVLLDEAGLAVCVAPGQQILTEKSDTERLAVGFQLPGIGCWQPVFAHHVAHPSTSSDAAPQPRGFIGKH